MSNGNGTDSLDQVITAQPVTAASTMSAPQVVQPTSDDFQKQLEALVNSKNEIQMPTSPPDPNDLGARAQYNAISFAKSMQDAGNPMTLDQFRAAVTGQYSALQSQAVQRQQDIFKANLEVQTEQAKRNLPRQMATSDLDALAELSSGSDQLDQLLTQHANACKAGFCNQIAANSAIMVASSPEAQEFNAARDAAIGPISKGVSGTSRLSDQDIHLVSSYLPELGDSAPVAQAKIAIMRSQIASIMNRKVQFYKASGFNTTNIEKGPMAQLNNKVISEAQQINGAPGTNVVSQTVAHANTASRLDAATSRQAQANAAGASAQQRQQPPQQQ